MFSKSFSAFHIIIATFSSLTQNKILNKLTEVEEKMSVYEESFNKAGFYTTKSSYSQIMHVWYRNITDQVVQYPLFQKVFNTLSFRRKMSNMAKTLSAQLDIFWSHDRVRVIWKIHFHWKKIQGGLLCLFVSYIESWFRYFLRSRYTIFHLFSIHPFNKYLLNQYYSRHWRISSKQARQGPVLTLGCRGHKYIWCQLLWRIEQDKGVESVGARAVLYEVLPEQTGFEQRPNRSSGCILKVDPTESAGGYRGQGKEKREGWIQGLESEKLVEWRCHWQIPEVCGKSRCTVGRGWGAWNMSIILHILLLRCLLNIQVKIPTMQ